MGVHFEDNKSHLHLRAGASVAGFIVDFYCHKAALVIEVDGDIHDLQQEEDARGEKVLSEMGLRIVRFRNEEVERDLSAVVGNIREFINHNSSLLFRQELHGNKLGAHFRRQQVTPALACWCKCRRVHR